MKPEKTFLPFEMDYLTEEIKAIAKEELGETDEVRKECLIKMRKLVRDEPKLYCCDHDLYLLSFLRARKFNIKRGFSVLQNYYHVKKTFPEVYGQHAYDLFKKGAVDKIINILPYRDEEGCVIMVLQLKHWKPEELKFSMFVHSLTCSLILCVEDPATQVCGVKIIVDAKGVGFHYVRYVHAKYLTLIARGLRNCLPVRFRALHIVNESSLFQYFWSFISIALSEKIRKRVQFHASNRESLLKSFDPAILPEEYGGTLDYDNSFWVKKLEAAEDLYDDRMKMGYRSSRSANRDETVQ